MNAPYFARLSTNKIYGQIQVYLPMAGTVFLLMSSAFLFLWPAPSKQTESSKHKKLRNEHALKSSKGTTKLLAQNLQLQQVILEQRKIYNNFLEAVVRQLDSQYEILIAIRKKWTYTEHLPAIRSNLNILLQFLQKAESDLVDNNIETAVDQCRLLLAEAYLWEAMRNEDLNKKATLVHSALVICENILETEKNSDVLLKIYYFLLRLDLEFPLDPNIPGKIGLLLQRLTQYLDQISFTDKNQYTVYRKAAIENIMAMEEKHLIREKHFHNLLENCRVVEQSQQNIPISMLQAFVLYRHLERYEEAAQIYARVCNHEKSCAAAFYGAGQVARRVEKDGSREAALEYYQKALAINRGYPEYLLKVAEMKRKLGKRKEAAEDLNRVVEICDNFYEHKHLIYHCRTGRNKAMYILNKFDMRLFLKSKE